MDVSFGAKGDLLLSLKMHLQISIMQILNLAFGVGGAAESHLLGMCPVDTPAWERRNSDFRLQLEHSYL